MGIFQGILRPTLLMGATLGLSACMYPDGTYGDGYVNGGYSSGYACDPYDPYDAYYNCDYGYGFANIGFGGGWYDNFFYPGYGLYVFDRIGHRHHMRNSHRRYWAHRRHQYGQRHVNRGHNRGKRLRNLSPEQRADRRERRAERLRGLTPEQRAERRERRAERRERRRNSGVTSSRAAMSQQDLRRRSTDSRREMRRANRQNGIMRSDRGRNVSTDRRIRPPVATQPRQRVHPSTRPTVTRQTVSQRPSVRRPAPARSNRQTPATRRRNINDK